MSPREQVCLAVLDMAGTTLAVTDAVPAAFREAFRAVGVTLDVAAIDRVRGRSKRSAVRELLQTAGGESAESLVEQVLGSFRNRLRERYADEAAPIPGAVETIRWFASSDVPVVLITGFDGVLARFLIDRIGWGSEPISAVVTDDDVAHGRPDPDLILRAMARCKVTDAASVLVAGDTVADLEAAHRAGAGLSIGVLTGAHTRQMLQALPHTVLLESVAAIPAWLTTRDHG